MRLQGWLEKVAGSAWQWKDRGELRKGEATRFECIEPLGDHTRELHEKRRASAACGFAGPWLQRPVESWRRALSPGMKKYSPPRLCTKRGKSRYTIGSRSFASSPWMTIFLMPERGPTRGSESVP